MIDSAILYEGSGSGDGIDDKGNRNNQLKAVAATAMATDNYGDNKDENTYITIN